MRKFKYKKGLERWKYTNFLTRIEQFLRTCRSPLLSIRRLINKSLPTLFPMDFASFLDMKTGIKHTMI